MLGFASFTSGGLGLLLENNQKQRTRAPYSTQLKSIVKLKYTALPVPSLMLLNKILHLLFGYPKALLTMELFIKIGCNIDNKSNKDQGTDEIYLFTMFKI
ncbi:hypothetical protein [Helicobacter suis]|uniref:hypothetical protein n=1 Tax=Helicobacter suis TaxID=104628 RepID=UPI0013D230C4|nr:hypothetical protein [Helicobacter suis]